MIFQMIAWWVHLSWSQASAIAVSLLAVALLVLATYEERRK